MFGFGLVADSILDSALDPILESGFDSFESEFLFDFGLKYKDNAGCFGSLDNFLFLCRGLDRYLMERATTKVIKQLAASLILINWRPAITRFLQD